jgi:hypothetical protein
LLVDFNFGGALDHAIELLAFDDDPHRTPAFWACLIARPSAIVRPIFLS